MIRELEYIRESINKIIELGDYDKDELIRRSRNLDIYIAEYIKKRLLNNDETPEK